jgi:hypothetical protein
LPEPTLIWGLFTRGIGLVFLISFVSLSGQVVFAAGRNGVLPAYRRFAKIEQDFPTWRRFYYFPTLLWINRSDAVLRALPLVGIAGALMMIYGGAFSFWGILTCYVCYLSLDPVMSLIFPWDCVLFECAVLALFLPATHALPNLDAVAAPAPALAWAYRLRLFRVMLGFGKQKFIGSRKKDLAYLKGFLIGQPLPSKIGWYAQKLPVAWLKPAVLFMFFVEIIAPFFVFVPGWLSVVFAVSTVFLMIGIQAMGSFGYFSLVTIVGCLPLLDHTTPALLSITSLFSAGQPLIVNAFVLVHTMASGAAFLFNSWLAHSWHLWAFWYQLPRWVQPLFTFFRVMHPTRWLHSYGVFPPNTGPGIKGTLLVEVTWDRKQWHELEFHYSPSNPRSAPRFVAPHHPRGDQAIIYDTFGLNPTSLMASLLGSFDPYPYGSHAPASAFAQSCLRGEGLALLKGPALDAHREPPLGMRMTTVLLEPCSLQEHRETGIWWKRRYIGPHVPPRELDPDYWKYALAEPELWHFDAIFWRRRSRLQPLLQAALRPDAEPLSLVLEDANPITREDVESFWSDFVPMLAGSVRTSFDTLPDTVEAVKARFDRDRQRAFYRLLNRFAMLLVARLEPLYLHRGLKPLIPVRTYFQLWMLVHHVIGCGRDAYLAAFADPESIKSHIPELTSQTGLYALAVFRFDELTFEAQKLRLIEAIIYPHDPATKRANTEKVRRENLEGLTGSERFFIGVSRTISGFFSVLPDVRDGFRGPRFEQGYPERYPTFRELDSGEVVMLPLDEESPDKPRAAEAGPAAAE